jgi:uncharacterized protein YdaU (DUF1376 family)
LLIIMHQWRMGHMREQDLRRIARMDPDAWSIAQASIKHLLSIDAEGLFYSPKCDRLKDEWGGKAKRAHEKAQKAAKARWDRVREKRDAQALLKQCPSSSSVSTPPPLSAYAPSGGGAASAAEAPPPPGDAPGMPAKSGRLDAASMPVHEHRARKRHKSEARAKPRVIAQKPALAASLRPKATVRAKTAPRRAGELQQHTLHTLVMDGATGAGGSAEDPRFETFRNLLMKFHSEVNGDAINGHAWGIKSAQALRDLLARDPHLTTEEFIVCLGHRVDAIRICMEHPPKKGIVSARDTIANVVNQLHYFKHGPSDAFGHRIA